MKTSRFEFVPHLQHLDTQRGPEDQPGRDFLSRVLICRAILQKRKATRHRGRFWVTVVAALVMLFDTEERKKISKWLVGFGI
jgi:hypothetical protein